MARDCFRDIFGVRDPATGFMNLLSGLEITVRLPGTSTTAPVYATRVTSSAITQPMTTDGTGVINFFAEPGDYDIFVHDTAGVPRIADQTFGWNSSPMANGGIPTAKLAADGNIQLGAISTSALQVIEADNWCVTPVTDFATNTARNFTVPFAGTYVFSASTTATGNVSATPTLAGVSWRVDGTIVSQPQILLDNSTFGKKVVMPTTAWASTLTAGTHTIQAISAAFTNMDGNDRGSFSAIQID